MCYTKYAAEKRLSWTVVLTIAALVALVACGSSQKMGPESSTLPPSPPPISLATLSISFTPTPSLEAVSITPTPSIPSQELLLSPTVSLTPTECFQPPPAVFLQPSATTLTVGQPLTVTFWSSPTFANGARVSLLADGTTLAYLDRMTPLEASVSEEQFLLQVFPEQIYLTSAGYGEFVLEAAAPVLPIWR